MENLLILPWDTKGIFKSSDIYDVIRHMEKHREFYKAVVTFTHMLEEGGGESYEYLQDLHERQFAMEREAMRKAERSNSKALCRMLRNFLDEKYKLDHNLERVECIVLRQKFYEVIKSCERSASTVDEMGEVLKNLLLEDPGKEAKELFKKQQERSDRLESENEAYGAMVDVMQGKMDCQVADRRANEKSEENMRSRDQGPETGHACFTLVCCLIIAVSLISLYLLE